jgi:hypothetical protein
MDIKSICCSYLIACSDINKNAKTKKYKEKTNILLCVTLMTFPFNFLIGMLSVLFNY